MAVQYCGTANDVKIDRPLQLNHREMKLKLHVASTKDSCFRVHLGENGYLMVYERNYGSSWTFTAHGMPESMRRVLTEYLTHRNDHGHYFLHWSEIAKLMDRLKRQEQTLHGAH